MALPQTAPTSDVDPFPELGMRRVRWVVITVTDGGVRADVAGLAHRFPIMRPVTLATANRLIRAGCAVVVRRDATDRPGAEDAGTQLPADPSAN